GGFADARGGAGDECGFGHVASFSGRPTRAQTIIRARRNPPIGLGCPRHIARGGEEKALCWPSEQPFDGGANAAPFDRLDRRTRLPAERTERRELLPPKPRVSQ